MGEYVFAPPPRPAVPVVGSGASFPVRRIWCVGRNYADHAREMGADPDREPPFFFAKPCDAVVPGGGTLPFPTLTKDFQHELELAVAIGRSGKDIPADDAIGHVFGYAVALDMTRRDLQAEAKKMSRPWDMAKGFDQSCPIGAITPADSVGSLAAATLELIVNGEVRQKAPLGDMIWPVADCIAVLSRFVGVAPGDIVLTGTPAGVAAVRPGDRLRGSCTGLVSLEVRYSAQ